MSEKQFVLYEHKGDYYILKNPRLHLDFIEMLGDALTSEEIVEELNQLNDKVVKLEEENEQLRQQVQILKKEVRDFLHLCDVCDIQSHLSDECEEVLNDE